MSHSLYAVHRICAVSLTLIWALTIAPHALAQNIDHSATSAVLTSDEIERRYEAAMEKCGALEGAQQDVCEQQAETEREKAEADAELRKKASEAHEDAVKRKNEVDWDLAKERCDTLSGDAKDACMADARARFNR